MSAIPTSMPPPPSEPVFRLSVEQYHAMIKAGVLTEDDRVELLEGVLVLKMAINPPHAFVVDAAAEFVRSLLSSGWYYRAQQPITLEDGEPEPDGVVARGSRRDYLSRHPGPADVALVIEVADSSLPVDRGIKLRSYARASIPVYWIINLIDRCVEIYARPDPAAKEPAYLDKQIRGESESIELTIDGKKLGTISVRELLP